MTDTEERSAQVDDLWAVHVIGPDDILPCASRTAAIRAAMWLNLGMWQTLAEPLSPLVWNVPVPWIGTREEHRAGLARQEAEDPRWSDVSDDTLAGLARYQFGSFVEPALTRANNGQVTITWPDGIHGDVLVSADVLESIAKEINVARSQTGERQS